MSGRRTPAAALLAAAVLILGTACGSRLPERDFTERSPLPDASGSASAARGEPVKVGIIASATSPIGATAFTGPRDGARAYFAWLNDHGGIGGRPVEVVTCDDQGAGVGNSDCVRRLVGQEKVFALVATTSLDYAGARQVSDAGVPDIGGQPIGAAYDTYPHLYSIYGSLAPREGTPGWGGKLYGGTEVYRYFKEEQGARTAAVVSYNQASSASYARLVAAGLKAEGYRVVTEQVDFALPNFRAVAADLKARDVDLVFDAMDTNGNVRLCEAMESAGVRVTAKVTNVQNWSSQVRKEYAGVPDCRNTLWVTGSSRNYADADHPAVADFRRGMDRYAETDTRSQWQLEGWAAAMWFADAAASCGDALTRACVETFMNRSTPYDASGLLLPTRFESLPAPPRTRDACVSVARWQDAASSGKGGWTTQGDMNENCFTVPYLGYRP
ncbi:ABC transporter substrate-binding protein [Streptomyces sp. NPDC051940]|uniref:ABC transporter substrate-binding protein n=1 Tax=Streptomyces sp. NPDC051940 TaxID=3155675 RepID=UPI00342891D0